jgi:hypothetical protein
MAFSAIRVEMTMPIAPNLSFTDRSLSGVGGALGELAVSPAGIWNCAGHANAAGSDVLAYSSPDGDTWIHRTMPYGGASAALNYRSTGMCYDPISDLFYVVMWRISGPSAWAVVTSTGEANWIDRPTTTIAEKRPESIQTDGSSIFAMVSVDNFGVKQGISSPTAATWTLRNQFVANALNLGFFNGEDYGNGVFVFTLGFHIIGVGFPGDLSKSIITSPNGITYTQRDTFINQRPYGVAYSPFTQNWCLVGSAYNPGGGVVAHCMVTDDPEEDGWTDRAFDFNGSVQIDNGPVVGLRDVAAFPGGFIAVGIDSATKPRIYVSIDDGFSWTEEINHPYYDMTNYSYNKVVHHIETGKIVICGYRPSAFNTTKIIISN